MYVLRNVQILLQGRIPSSQDHEPACKAAGVLIVDWRVASFGIRPSQKCLQTVQLRSAFFFFLARVLEEVWSASLHYVHQRTRLSCRRPRSVASSCPSFVERMAGSQLGKWEFGWAFRIASCGQHSTYYSSASVVSGPFRVWTSTQFLKQAQCECTHWKTRAARAARSPTPHNMKMRRMHGKREATLPGSVQASRPPFINSNRQRCDGQFELL